MSLLYRGRYDYQTKEFTLEQFNQFNELPENKDMRFEFIDGYVYAMAAPTPNHSRVTQFIMSKLYPYFLGKRCEPFTDVDIYFKHNMKTDVLRPDIFVNCDTNRIKETHCEGSPEFIAEVISPSSNKDDYHFKKNYYMNNGAKEYWIVDHLKRRVTVITTEATTVYSFLDTVHVGLFEGLSIDFGELSQILGIILPEVF